MHDWSPSRRTFLRTGVGTAALAGVAALSGCNGSPAQEPDDGDTGSDGSDDSSNGADSSDGGDGRRRALDRVPAGAQAVVHADLGDIITDERLQADLNALLAESDYDGGPSTVREGLDAIEQAYGVDPRKIEAVTAFGALPEGDDAPFAATIVTTALDKSTVESLASDWSDGLQETGYRDTTVYATPGASPGWAALPGNGEVVVGAEAAVRAVLDLEAGVGSAVSGTLRTVYETTSEGFVRFATTVADRVPRMLGLSTGDGPLTAIESVRGDVTRGGDRRLAVTVEASSGEAADRVATQLRTGRETLLRQARNGSAWTSPAVRDRLVAVVENASVSRDGSAVTLTVPDGLFVTTAVLAAVVASFVLGLGEPEVADVPRASFEFEYDDGMETLEIIHQAGDAIAASSLYVRGSGIGTGTTSWAAAGGSTSMTVDGAAAIGAGDSITFEGVSPAYEVTLVWRADESSAVLAQDQGPEA